MNAKLRGAMVDSSCLLNIKGELERVLMFSSFDTSMDSLIDKEGSTMTEASFLLASRKKREEEAGVMQKLLYSTQAVFCEMKLVMKE
jgi:hypothetical protein